MSAFLSARKDIFKTTSILVSANKNVFSKNRILPILSWIENPAMTMSYLFKAELSIFVYQYILAK